MNAPAPAAWRNRIVGEALVAPEQLRANPLNFRRHPRPLVSETIRAFQAAGLAYYNEAILVNAAGTLALRAGKQFRASRKLGRSHQNVLIFVKGDGFAAAKACGDVRVREEVEAEG